MKINIVPCSNDWLLSFEKEKQHLLLTLGKVQIEHIGSTAVLGLGAKPIIDIMVGLPNFAQS